MSTTEARYGAESIETGHELLKYSDILIAQVDILEIRLFEFKKFFYIFVFQTISLRIALFLLFRFV